MIIILSGLEKAYLKPILEVGCDVIAVNYRGSSGYGHDFEHSEGEEQRVQDVLAVRDYAVRILGVPGNKVFLSGISHGASLVASAAAQGQELGGLILISWPGGKAAAESKVVKGFHRGIHVVEIHGE
jgi:dienelactone hydrolase